jgi:hypothetical protein
MDFYQPDLSFLKKFPYEPRAEAEKLFANKHLMAVGSYKTAWMALASFGIELEDICRKHNTPELFSQALNQIGPGGNEMQEMMKAYKYYQDPRFAEKMVGRTTPKQILGVVSHWETEQQKLSIGEIAKYDVETTVDNLSFESLSGNDVLSVSPTTSGAMGEDTIKSILDRLGIKYQEQLRNAFICDFGEAKRVDFKVGTVKAKGDARLSNGFYIETTSRLTESNKDLGLFYLLHQITKHSDLPTIVVYDGPALSERVWEWARLFRERHERENKLFAVVTNQQFREWALRKLGSQAK